MKPLLIPLIVLALSVGRVHAEGIADRSAPVRVALEKVLKKKAAEITAEDLATVKELDLPHIHITSFKDDDFAGLTKLKKLHFYSLLHNRGRATDPIAINGKVFAKLSSLEELSMEESLGLLPDDVFTGLTSLKILDICDSALHRLPASMLTLPKIEVVYFEGNGMSKEDYATLKKKLGDKLKATRPN